MDFSIFYSKKCVKTTWCFFLADILQKVHLSLTIYQLIAKKKKVQDFAFILSKDFNGKQEEFEDNSKTADLLLSKTWHIFQFSSSLCLRVIVQMFQTREVYYILLQSKRTLSEGTLALSFRVTPNVNFEM